MANILINGISSKTGGGKNILDNFLMSLTGMIELQHKYFVLTPNYMDYSNYNSTYISIVNIQSLYKNNLFFAFLYYYKLPKVVKEYEIDLIFNLGDVVIPPIKGVKQIYFFDWAYAVYDDDYIWGQMSKKDFFVRKLKVFMIDKYIKTVDLTYAQTSNIKERLTKKYKLKYIKIVPTPVGDIFNNIANKNYIDFNLPKDRVKFFYPAGYAPHKNFEIIPSVCKLIKRQNLPYTIILTLDNELDFVRKLIREHSEVIINLGKVDYNYMPSLYNQIDVLFFPSLLESYGFPYVEAMVLKKPIITSNLDFAHAVCGSNALYFDPFIAESIIEKMKLSSKMKYFYYDNKILDNLDWSNICNIFQNEINKLINH